MTLKPGRLKLIIGRGILKASRLSQGHQILVAHTKQAPLVVTLV